MGRRGARDADRYMILETSRRPPGVFRFLKAFLIMFKYISLQAHDHKSSWLRHVVPDVYVCIAVVQTCGVVLTCLCAVLPQPDPVDAIKSKMQGDSLEKPRFPTMRAAARYILKHEGPMGFFKGLGPCMLRAAPVNGATFLMFELTMRALDLVM